MVPILVTGVMAAALGGFAYAWWRWVIPTNRRIRNGRNGPWPWVHNADESAYRWDEWALRISGVVLIGGFGLLMAAVFIAGVIGAVMTAID